MDQLSRLILVDVDGIRQHTHGCQAIHRIRGGFRAERNAADPERDESGKQDVVHTRSTSRGEGGGGNRRAGQQTMLPARTTGTALAARENVELGDMLDRCCGLETRSAALYRSFAAAVHDRPDLCALWTALACEEDEHVHVLNDARARLPTSDAWVTQLSPRWDGVAREIEAKLCEAERLGDGASSDQQLAAALELEMTEIEPLRQMLLAVSQHCPPRPIAEIHALHLADGVERCSTDRHVREQAALLRARACPAAV